MGKEIVEPARAVPVAAEADLCVLGGSCTGVFASVAAARMGLSVALVENHGVFGGTATAGLVNVWHSLLDTERNLPIIAGLSAEVLERLKTRHAVVLGANGNYVLNTEELKIELDELVRAHDVRPFLHTRFAAPFLEDGRLAAAVIEDKTGRRAIRARVFVDATGDGDVVARLNLPTELRADLQPPTMCAAVSGLGQLHKCSPGFSLAKAVFDEAEPERLPRGLLWASPRVGSADDKMVAGTRVPGANCADADELTAAEMEGRRQVRAMLDILRRREGGSGVSLVELASHIGIRETRHACCLHRLTEQEVLEGVRFDDAIANGSYRVDVHHSGRPGLTFRYLDGREVYHDLEPSRPTREGRWRPEQAVNPTFYQIPYRCLVPRGCDNLLVAGRAIDADRGAYGAIRVMLNTNQTGQAAGVAAALALREGCAVGRVAPARLRAALREQGCVIF